MPTFASVTETPCTCGWLQKEADRPASVIVFDARTGEYHFRYREKESDAYARLIIYYCPFCGGAAPESKRALLFAVIPPQEEQRLARLLARIKTMRSALKTLGRADRDEPSGIRIYQPETDEKRPSIEHRRTLVYTQLSAVADVTIQEMPDGKARWWLHGKYVGPPATEAGK